MTNSQTEAMRQAYTEMQTAKWRILTQKDIQTEEQMNLLIQNTGRYTDLLAYFMKSAKHKAQIVKAEFLSTDSNITRVKSVSLIWPSI